MRKLNALQLEILHLGNQKWSTAHMPDFEELASLGLIEFEEIADDYGGSIRVTVLENKVNEFFDQSAN